MQLIAISAASPWWWSIRQVARCHLDPTGGKRLRNNPPLCRALFKRVVG